MRHRKVINGGKLILIFGILILTAFIIAVILGSIDCFLIKSICKICQNSDCNSSENTRLSIINLFLYGYIHLVIIIAIIGFLIFFGRNCRKKTQTYSNVSLKDVYL